MYTFRVNVLVTHYPTLWNEILFQELIFTHVAKLIPYLYRKKGP